jgi:glycosyltransferase involved in cell wall biosynthesis
MTKRVLFIDQSGALGGAELSLLDIARRLGPGNEVALLSDGPFRARLEEVGVPVSLFPLGRTAGGIRRATGPIGAVQALPRLAAVAARLARRARAFDVLYANTQKALVVAAAAGRIARRPVVWHLRDILADGHFSRSNRVLAVFLANRAVRRVIANSRATAEAFVESGGKKDLVRVIWNGIDAADFAPAGDDARQLHAAPGFAEDAPIVGVFGRLAPWKGQDVVLQALAALPAAHGMIVGAPLFGEHDYERELRRLADALGIAHRVHFLGFRSDIPALMRASSIVVHSSIAAEPFGRTVVEGMLAGKPVVASRAGGPCEIIEDRVSGILVPPGDPAALAAVLKELLDNPAFASRIASAGRARALAKFSLEPMVDAIRRQLDDVTRGRDSPVALRASLRPSR